MRFSKFLVPLLACIASVSAFKYPFSVKNTNSKSPLYFTIETGPPHALFGRNLQLRPSGDEFEAVVDQSSEVAIVSLNDAAVQLRGIRGGKIVPLNNFAGLRNVRKIDGGNTTLKEVYFSKKPEHGKQHFRLVYNTRSNGRYFLTHGVVIPKGVQVVASGFSMCPRGGADYYQLTFIVSEGRKLIHPQGCIPAGVWTTLAPSPGKLASSNPNREKEDVNFDEATVTTYA